MVRTKQAGDSLSDLLTPSDLRQLCYSTIVVCIVEILSLCYILMIDVSIAQSV
jgi:hypothetical protein